MLKGFVKMTAIALSASLAFSGMSLQVHATDVSSVLPSGGINIALSKGTDLEKIQVESKGTASNLESLVELKEIQASKTATEGVEAAETEESLHNLIISQAKDYLTVRMTPDKRGKEIGKFYKNAAGKILSEQEGWYEIESGNVTGFVKAEYCAVGEEALALAEELGTRMAQVQCDRLLVRKEAKTDGEVLGMVAMYDELMVTEEMEGWVKVDIEEGFGWIDSEFVKLYTEFEYAETKEEEADRLERESRERHMEKTKAALETISTVEVTNENEMGIAVAEYAVQFIGNPYVWGGTSLTDGADCSGFVMKVYEEFGVSLPHSSAADRKQGYAVKGGLENAQPGDLICYSGHVALYIGDGKIVHASNEKDGIKVSKAAYRKILAIRRIF